MQTGIILSRQEADEAKDTAWRAHEAGYIDAVQAAEIAVDVESRAVPVSTP
jgi:hypothetical protein